MTNQMTEFITTDFKICSFRGAKWKVYHKMVPLDLKPTCKVIVDLLLLLLWMKLFVCINGATSCCHLPDGVCGIYVAVIVCVVCEDFDGYMCGARKGGFSVTEAMCEYEMMKGSLLPLQLHLVRNLYC